MSRYALVWLCERVTATDWQIMHPPSLDLEENGDLEQESHFLGAGAFSSIGLGATFPPPTSGATGSLSFRQVSSDPRYPVFFVKNPSLLYGRTPNTGKAVFEAACQLTESLGKDIPSTSIAR